MSPKNSPHFTLSEKQVDVLAIHHVNIFRVLLNYLDADFNFKIYEQSNWPMLNQHIIEMLVLEDRKNFDGVIQSILQNMDQLNIDNPFVAASFAEAGKTDTEKFNEMLNRITDPSSINASGLIHFHSGFLGLGDHFSTLWTLRLIELAGKTKDYEEIVHKSLDALSKDIEYVLRKSPDFIGFMLYVSLLVSPEKYKDLIERCIEFLLDTQEGDGWWYGIKAEKNKEKDLRSNGFVAYDLLLANNHIPGVISSVEKWLISAFELSNEEPETLPQIFSISQKAYHPDVWSQGWIRAIIAAGMYLKIRRPDYSVTKYILSNYIQTNVELNRYKQFAVTVQPFLPPQEELYRYQIKLREFWKRGEYDKSIFIMRRMGEDLISKGILQIILEVLTKYGLVGRYVGDCSPDYYPDLSENNNLYMRGCKYGIAIFERLSAKGKEAHVPNPNILVEIGFMQGKGAEVLILFDEDSMKMEPIYDDSNSLHGHDLPPVISGTIYKPFKSSSDSELVALRKEVEKWAIGIAGRVD